MNVREALDREIIDITWKYCFYQYIESLRKEVEVKTQQEKKKKRRKEEKKKRKEEEEKRRRKEEKKIRREEEKKIKGEKRENELFSDFVCGIF